MSKWPRDPKNLRQALRAAHDGGSGSTIKGQGSPSDNMLGLLNGKLNEIFEGDDGQRISLLRWLWGVKDSSKELTFAQVQTTLDWLIDAEATRWSRKESGGYIISAEAENTCHAIIDVYCEEKGQMRLPW